MLFVLHQTYPNSEKDLNIMPITKKNKIIFLSINNMYSKFIFSDVRFNKDYVFFIN